MENNWTVIPGFSDYLIHPDLGVKAMERIYRRGDKERLIKERFPKIRIGGTGYWEVGLMIDSKMHTKKVHRLLMMAFRPTEGMESLTVNHIDGDKLNNKLDNLEWCTRGDNVRHSVKTGLSWNSDFWTKRSLILIHPEYGTMYTFEEAKILTGRCSYHIYSCAQRMIPNTTGLIIARVNEAIPLIMPVALNQKP